MSLHINMTEEAEGRIRSQKRNNLITATLTAFLSCTLLGILLYIGIVVIPTVEKPEVTAYQAELEDLPPSDRPVTPDRTKSRPAASTPTQASIITSTTVTDTVVVSVDIDMPNADIAISMGPDIGNSFGNDLGTDGTGFGGSPGGSTLEGIFYDFKQTQNGTPTNISPQGATEEMKRFVNGKWNQQLFVKYFKAPTKLYASQFYIARCPATEAPKAYKCEDRVKDSRWCAVYRGKVKAPKSGKFRFVGAGDDSVVVRFNNENVFDYGWVQLTLGKQTVSQEWRNVLTGKVKNAGMIKELKDAGVNIPPCDFYQYTSTGHWNGALGGLLCGKTFEVVAGETYPIEVLVSEIPGGEFGVGLLIEEVGGKPEKKDAKTGAPILPLFRTNYALPEPGKIKGIGGDFIPFDNVGVVWEVVK